MKTSTLNTRTRATLEQASDRDLQRMLDGMRCLSTPDNDEATRAQYADVVAYCATRNIRPTENA